MSIDGDSLEKAWQEALRDWDDDQTHRRFLELSRLSGALAQAGRRYRDIKEQDPERRESAERHIERLLGVAMGEMHGRRTPPKPKSRRGVLWLVTLVASALLLYLMSALLRTH